MTFGLGFLFGAGTLFLALSLWALGQGRAPRGDRVATYWRDRCRKGEAEIRDLRAAAQKVYTMRIPVQCQSCHHVAAFQMADVHAQVRAQLRHVKAERDACESP